MVVVDRLHQVVIKLLTVWMAQLILAVAAVAAAETQLHPEVATVVLVSWW